MKTFLYIARFAALSLILAVLLAVAPAAAQNVVHQGETTTLGVVEVPGETYSWELYNDSTVNFAKVPGACPTTLADFVGGNIGPTVTVEWKKPGVYFFKVTAWNVSGCTNNLRVGRMRVLEALPTAKLTTSPICIGEPAKVTVEFTGTAPWKFTYTDGTNTWELTNILTPTYEFTIDPGPKATVDYQIISVTDKWGTNDVPGDLTTQEVYPKPRSSEIYLYEP